MVLTFKDYQSNDIDFNELGQINESHQYEDSICSVMDKLAFYVKRSVALETSNLNESAKRAYNKDIRLNRDERIAAACIFNEMLRKYKENMREELSVYESIINYGSLLEEGVEVDFDKFIGTILNEKFGENTSAFRTKFKELFQKGKKGLANASKAVIDGAKTSQQRVWRS